jgi:NitT/TauT family transport system ATP-binding protein/nitrate/nitrite transport system substrate-binding protein
MRTNRTPSQFRIGVLRLTDSAPLIIAKELGYFAAEGVEVSLSVEPSWANIADKLAYGLLDGAMMLPPLALAVSLGLSGSGGPERIIVPAALSLNGNTVTLAERWAAAVLPEKPLRHDAVRAVEAARRFARVIREGGEKPVLAVVHTFSTHNLLLRYWLAVGGIDPDRDVVFTVVPPAETVKAMAAQQIDGFCAGAPWGEVAALEGLGRTVATSHAIWNNGLEKVLMRAGIADRHPALTEAILRALLQAASYCDDRKHAEHVASILSSDSYIGLPAEIILTSLPGAEIRRTASAPPNADISIFRANAANFPWVSHLQWFLGQIMRWGYVAAGADLRPANAVFHPELYVRAARSLGLPVPAVDVKSEGCHSGPWLLLASPAPIPMGAFSMALVSNPSPWIPSSRPLPLPEAWIKLSRREPGPIFPPHQRRIGGSRLSSLSGNWLFAGSFFCSLFPHRREPSDFSRLL